MPFYKVTFHESYRCATVYHYGCTFHCSICSYKLRSGATGVPGLSFPRPERFWTAAEIFATLSKLSIDRVYFMGGEPTIDPEFDTLVSRIKRELGVETILGHTNGSRLPIVDLDAANVGFKAWDAVTHQEITGRPRQPIYDNFAAAHRAGMRLKANLVMIPGVVDIDQARQLARWLAGLSREIPLHLMGYIPIPGLAYPKPENAWMRQAVEECSRELNEVNFSNLSVDDALHLTTRDERFHSRRIL